jgi:hypothetical protein
LNGSQYDVLSGFRAADIERPRPEEGGLHARASRYSEEQVAGILREHDAGATVSVRQMPLIHSCMRGAYLAIARPNQPTLLRTTTYKLLTPSLAQRRDLERQGEEVDEAAGVGVAVEVAGAERGELFRIQRVRRRAALDDQVPLVELQGDFAGVGLLGDVDEGVDRLTQRREPESVVDKLGVALGDEILVVQRGALDEVKREQMR